MKWIVYTDDKWDLDHLENELLDLFDEEGVDVITVPRPSVEELIIVYDDDEPLYRVEDVLDDLGVEYARAR